MVPVPDVYIGAYIDVSYSQDDINRSYLTRTTGVVISGQAYVVFETPHFTIFTLEFSKGVFTINNDGIYSTGLNVTLNSNVPNATDMKFGNSVDEVNAASWISYTSSYGWTLSGAGGSGNKTVYAMYKNSNDGSTGMASDTIIYGSSDADMLLKIYYFGSGSEFTKNWQSNNCTDLSTITVQRINTFDSSGFFSPLTLSANTIYVLNSGRHILQGTNFITFGGSCIALVGSGGRSTTNSNTYVYTQSILNTDGLINASGQSNLIVDNISINGLDNGSGTDHG